MNEETDLQAEGSPPSKETVSRYLRRVRESRRITLEKVTRDTKLNLDYLYALEQGDYKVLPAEAYVRIYLRSLAKYLQLDPDQVVSRYNRETCEEEEKGESKRPTRGIKSLAPPSKMKPIGLVLALVVVVAVLSFLRTGTQERGGTTPSAPVSPRVEPTVPLPEQAEKPTGKPVPAVEETPDEKEIEEIAKTALVTSNDSIILLRVVCLKDSSWISVYRDMARPRRQTLHQGEERVFKASRSFHAAFGRLEVVSLFLNGRKLEMPKRRGVQRLRIDRDGYKRLGRNVWLTLFPNSSGRTTETPREE